MKRWLGVLALLALLAPAAARASVIPSGCGVPDITAPYARAFVNGTCYDLTDELTTGADPDQVHLDETVTLGGTEIDLAATLDSDPFITFGATTTNLIGGPVTYAFLFSTPITPGLYGFASSSGGLSLTAGPAGPASVDNSLIYPTYISGYGTLGLVATNLGVDLGTALCSAPASGTTVCPQGTTSSAFAPAFYDNLEALLTYDQTGAFSVASWSGAVTITAVPLPAAAWLFGSALAGLGALRWKRRNSEQRSAG